MVRFAFPDLTGSGREMMGSSLGDGASASRQLVTEDDGDETVRRRGCPVSPTSVSGASTPVLISAFLRVRPRR